MALVPGAARTALRGNRKSSSNEDDQKKATTRTAKHFVFLELRLNGLATATADVELDIEYSTFYDWLKHLRDRHLPRL